MGKGKRNPAIVISSSDDDDDKDTDFLLKTGYRFSESAPNRKNPKRAKRVSLTSSCPRPFPPSGSTGFDEIYIQDCYLTVTVFIIKVYHIVDVGSSCNKDLWVEKYKPSCLEELAVHKKKVEEVRMWFEERLRNSAGNSDNNVILISGQAGVGKSATIYAIARHLGVEVHEWNTPTPTIWKEHLHNSNSGIHYMSKLDEFESFVERIRKYGLVCSSLTRVYPLSVILLIDDLPVVNEKVSYGRLQRCLHLLVQSVRLPTAILINDSGRSESAEHHSRYWEELQLALQNAGVCKVTFNPITVNSIKRVLKKIRKEERFEASDEQIDIIAKASGGDIRHAITSLQYISLKPRPRHLLSAPKDYPEEKGSWSGHLDDGVSLPYGKDATLSVFHALGKFLHNKRETGSLVTSDRDAILLKEKLVRCPLKMDAPELVLSQAHGQARLIADFLHENVLDFVSEEVIEDAWVIGKYLSDTDLLLALSSGTSSRSFEVENVKQSIAASIAVRGVLFGNCYPVSSRWHSIRRPMLWQVEQSLWHNKCRMLGQSGVDHINIRWNNHSVFATEFKPTLNWLGDRVTEDIEGYEVLNEANSTEDEYHDMCLDDKDYEIDDDEIEDW
ncbi:cell cycle checkpoint protein rad17 [Phtheirospermum japonicum]|uniref:Cell cycle checkpoint protein rad17 n=1 Tax=Phtheirospermum japonicum TaxID=374723 RepID=A0A830DG46_9LAMI|nr:cell cycle checkpoint protein rad17 [Phtheirospermum japonicum]